MTAVACTREPPSTAAPSSLAPLVVGATEPRPARARVVALVDACAASTTTAFRGVIEWTRYDDEIRIDADGHFQIDERHVYPRLWMGTDPPFDGYRAYGSRHRARGELDPAAQARLVCLLEHVQEAESAATSTCEGARPTDTIRVAPEGGVEWQVEVPLQQAGGCTPPDEAFLRCERRMAGWRELVAAIHRAVGADVLGQWPSDLRAWWRTDPACPETTSTHVDLELHQTLHDGRVLSLDSAGTAVGTDAGDCIARRIGSAPWAAHWTELQARGISNLDVEFEAYLLFDPPPYVAPAH